MSDLRSKMDARPRVVTRGSDLPSAVRKEADPLLQDANEMAMEKSSQALRGLFTMFIGAWKIAPSREQPKAHSCKPEKLFRLEEDGRRICLGSGVDIFRSHGLGMAVTKCQIGPPLMQREVYAPEA